MKNTEPTHKIRIFRSGRHTAMNGKTLTFSDDDLKGIVAAYNPDLHEAPLVVGHPEEDDPAWGWVKSLSFTGDGYLEAHVSQVDPIFAEMVKSGRYKKISASLYPPNTPNNPAPDGYYLRHVGFLGGQPPAVKGLGSATFAEGDSGCNAITCETIETINFTEVRIVMPDDITPPITDPLAAQRAQLEQREAELKAKELLFAEQTSALEVKQREVQNKETIDFVEICIQKGQILPKDQPGVVALMNTLADQQTELEFSEGDGNNVKRSGVDQFKQFLSSLPAQVNYSEVSSETGEQTTVSYATPSGFSVDPEGLKLDRQIQLYATTHKIDYADAAVAVCGQ